MGLLNTQEYLLLLHDEIDGVTPPTGPVRRIGAAEHEGAELESVRRDLGELRGGGNLGLGTDVALEAGSYLYSAGAPHAVWRHWIGLAAFGHLLQRSYATACPYLVLAGEWRCLAALRAVSPGRCSPSAEALWRLAVGEIDDPRWPDDDVDDGSWRALLAAVPAGDHVRTGAALATMATFWIEETEGDWEFFHPHSPPDFEPEPCAAAAIARRAGYSPAGLRSDVLRFLEPGLAEGEPEPLYPRLVPAGLPPAGEE